MDRLDLNTPTNINGLLFGADGKITAFTICSNKMMQVICHGLSEHYVTSQGGFHAGKGSYTLNGVALGKNAIADNEGVAIDAIQLGTGTNAEPLTFKVYDYKLLGSDGKIPSERLPNLTIEMEIVNNILSWRYVGSSVWTPLLDITNLQGEDGQSFRVDEYGNLDEAKIIEITNSVTTGRYLFLVNPLGDIRVDNATPTALNGDMSRHILMYDGDDQEWFDYGEFTGLQGEPGTPVELQNNGTYIRWKYTTSPTWLNLINLLDIKGDKGDTGDSGADGATIELDGTDVNYIRWRVVGDEDWINLLNKSEIKGAKGDAGDNGREIEFRVYLNKYLQWRYVGGVTWTNTYDLSNLDIYTNNNTNITLQGDGSLETPFGIKNLSDDKEYVNKNGEWVEIINNGYTPKNSIEIDSDELQLVGDELEPDDYNYYGTDGDGNKGFHPIPSDPYKLDLDQTEKQTLSDSPIFNNLTPECVVIVDADGSLKTLEGLTWDDVNKRLGVGIAAPPDRLSVDGNVGVTGNLLFRRENGTIGSQLIRVIEGGSESLQFNTAGANSHMRFLSWNHRFYIYREGYVEVMRVTSPNGYVGINTQTPTKNLHVAGEAGYVSAIDEGAGDLDFASRKTAKTFGKQSLTTKAPVITVWDSSDYRDGQVKTTKAEYYNETTLYYEQRFDWNEDMSVKRIEIKDDISGLWVQRNYTWSSGIPSVSETIITAWTI